MKDLELKITVDEANLVLESLGQMPFNKVYTLIGKIQDQAAQQLRSEEPAAADVTQLETKSKSAVES